MTIRRFPATVLAFLCVQLAWLLLARSVADVGFGWAPRPHEDRVTLGWMANESDSLSYSSWLEQARAAQGPMQILYTTSPHRSAYINPVLWLPGFLSRMLGGDPAGWLNLGGILAALVCTAMITVIVRLLGFSNSAALWSAAVIAFSSGWSWILMSAAKVVPFNPLQAADLRFMDLLPSSCLLVYPYHAVALAILAMLWAATLSLETEALRERRRTTVAIAFIAAGSSALLASARPYEPCAFLGVYALLVVASWRSSSPWLRRRRIRIWLLIALPALPFVIFAAWLSAQPVWNSFASLSVAQSHSRAFWIVGFGALWALSLASLPRLWRQPTGAGRMPALWIGIVFAALVLVNVSNSKIASGAGLALAVGAGLTLERVAQVWTNRRARLACFIALSILVGPLSLLVIIREARLYPPAVERSLLEIARDLRPRPAGPVRTVLCDAKVGAALPGIAGVRVYAGHWALTDNYEIKVAELRDAGLVDGPEPENPSDQLRRLRLLAEKYSEVFVLVRDTNAIAITVASSAGFHAIRSSGPWHLYRFNPARPDQF